MLVKDGAYSHQIVIKETPTFNFIGVTTTKSSIMKVFPLWTKELGHPEVQIEGMDLKIHDQPEAYRRAVAQIKNDPLSLGALVTTHKIDLLEASRDMFEYLDPYAEICGEISSISKLDGRLEGHAKDPISAGLSLDAIIDRGFFGRTGGEVLCFGAGGSSVATLLHLINKNDPADRPRRFVVVNRSQGRLDRMQAMVEKLKTDIRVEYICNQDPLKNDAIMAGMPEYSVVINATGMGKDTPGSPITNKGFFPRHAIPWEFNYRGELDFLHQALAQKEQRELVVEDGWVYFLHGWTQVIAQVYHLEITPHLFDRLAKLAESVRK
jgi:shikimate dehydrogenase